MHDRQREYLPEDVTCILDLLHVMERLWKVAWCLFEETTQKAEAERWVEIGGVLPALARSGGRCGVTRWAAG